MPDRLDREEIDVWIDRHHPDGPGIGWNTTAQHDHARALRLLLAEHDAVQTLIGEDSKLGKACSTEEFAEAWNEMIDTHRACIDAGLGRKGA